MRAIITGITSQDGILLARHLSKLNYQIIGVAHDLTSKKIDFVKKMTQNIEIIQGNLSDESIFSYLCNYKGEIELYNLAAISNISECEKDPISAFTVNFKHLYSFLNYQVQNKKKKNIKIFNASTCEIFAGTTSKIIDENENFSPINIYGFSKLNAHLAAVYFRNFYDLFCTNGILFNHESEFRDVRFVSKKITKSIAEIKFGLRKKLTLGNLSATRDWGYAGDYVRAMHKTLQAEKPEDFIIATGKSHSILDFVLITLKIANLGSDLEKYVIFDKNSGRQVDRNSFVGNSNKLRNQLNWQPEVNFEEIIEKMFKYEYDMLKEQS